MCLCERGVCLCVCRSEDNLWELCCPPCRFQGRNSCCEALKQVPYPLSHLNSAALLGFVDGQATQLSILELFICVCVAFVLFLLLTTEEEFIGEMGGNPQMP